MSRNNFIALAFVLMMGTAALPHLLTRYYTTPGVSEARRSVFWSLFFIFLLYVTAPAYAVFAKWEVYSNLIGSNISTLPAWVAYWGKVGLVKIEDINGDGLLQLAELSLNTDVIVLATPEIAGLPYVVSGLVAAGARGSPVDRRRTAAHDFKRAVARSLLQDGEPSRVDTARLVVAKSQLLIVRWSPPGWRPAAGQHPLHGRTGIFDRRLGVLSRAGAGNLLEAREQMGSDSGHGRRIHRNDPVRRTHPPFLGGSMENAWFSINPISAGAFGVPVGFLTIILVSLLTPAPPKSVQDLVDYMRFPNMPAPEHEAD